MIEPTGSENQCELDRFCEAMFLTRAVIEANTSGTSAPLNKPVKTASHNHHMLIASAWDKPSSKAAGILSMDKLNEDECWPPVARFDDAYGDKHLVCDGPPADAYLRIAHPGAARMPPAGRIDRLVNNVARKVGGEARATRTGVHADQ